VTPRIVIDQTSPQWDRAVERAIGLLMATKADASLVELEHTVNAIVASENAESELAHLVLALSVIGGAATEFLAQNVGTDFAEMLGRIEKLIAETIRRRRDE
jgi:hypothetical protein